MIEYNPKIDYLFCKFLFFDVLPNDELRWRKLFQGANLPRTKAERNLVKARQILDFMKSKECQINHGSLINLFLMINKKMPSISEVKFLEQVLDMLIFSKVKEEKIPLLICKIKPFNKYNEQFAISLYNLLRIKRGVFPVVFYPSTLKHITNLLDENKMESASYFIKELIIQSACMNHPHKVISAAMIKSRIQIIKKELIKKFNILELFVYGSYAREEENRYSDLDVIVKTSQKVDEKYKYLLFSFLSFHLGLHVDGKVVNNNDIYLEKGIEVLSDIKKIF